VWKRLVTEWESLSGEPWSTMSRPVALTRSVLLVEAVSPAAVSLLRFGAAGLAERLNQALGAAVIEEIKLRAPGRSGVR
jgi:predicted nucleic acid-binding Zn ribbon protein